MAKGKKPAVVCSRCGPLSKVGSGRKTACCPYCGETLSAVTVLTDHARAAFLATLRDTGNISESARSAGFSRQTMYEHYNAKDDDGEWKEPLWRKAWDDALEEAKDVLRTEARRRAVEGWNEPVYQKGELVGTVRRYSDTLLTKLLTAHCEEHAEKRAIDLRTPPGETVNVTVVDGIDRAKEIAQILQEIEELNAVDQVGGDEDG